MPAFKSPRIIDADLLDGVRRQPCAICGAPPPSDPHHIKSRAAWGPDTAANVVALCRHHHSEIHAIGRHTFARKYGIRWGP